MSTPARTDSYQPVAGRNNGGDDLKTQVRRMESAFARAMPKGFEAVQLIRDIETCLQQTPKLAQCEPKSVLGAAMTCAQLGLRPGVGALGQAWLVPFWDRQSGQFRAQLIIGYQGYVELAHRSGRVSSIHSRIVYSNDYFEVEYGAAEDKWVHKPCLDGDRGSPRLFYAVGRMTDGGYAITEPMTVADMQRHRDRFAMARNKQGKIVGPWVDHFDSMAKKTMVLQLMKLMPKSTEQQRAITADGSVRLDVTPGGIDNPDYIEGDLTDEAITDAEPAGDAEDAGEVQMAGKTELARLKEIRRQERYETAGDWADFVASAIGRRPNRDNNLTADEANTIIAMFDEQPTQTDAPTPEQE